MGRAWLLWPLALLAGILVAVYLAAEALYWRIRRRW